MVSSVRNLRQIYLIFHYFSPRLVPDLLMTMFLWSGCIYVVIDYNIICYVELINLPSLEIYNYKYT